MNIGLVLSGGMAKGAYQIGALKAIEKLIPREDIKFISCASIGVLNGYAYATNNLGMAEKMWRRLCTTEDSRIFISQLLKSSLLQKNIIKLHKPDQKLPPKFFSALFDFTHKSIVYKNLSSIDSSKIPSYLRASVAMPVYNKPVKIDDVCYFDGAMIDNIPVYPLLKYNLDYIICVYFDDTCYKFESDVFDNRIIKITFPSKNVLKQSLLFQKDSIDDMIKRGYDRTSYILKAVLSSGHDNLNEIYSTIEQINQEYQTSSSSLRITGDVLVTNLNKITQRLTKRKIQ